MPPRPPRLWLSLVGFLAGIYLLFAPGRILFPDDEIVYQTTASLWERGSLAVEGIPKRTGEPRDRPDGTFGWAPGVDGQRYGFFGHGLSVVALPFYGLGKAMAAAAPEPWRHALRSDHYIYHHRSQAADWTRLCVSLTNCFITALAAYLLLVWLQLLGIGWRAATGTALAFGLSTSAWPYAGTFLSEPLSTVVLLAATICIERHRQAPGSPAGNRFLVAGAALAGASVHVHLLNLAALPVLLAHAVRLPGGQRPSARGLAGALAVGLLILALLGLDHFLRFGSPFETGRFDHYGRWAAPWEALAAFLVSPGRGLLVYSPAVVVGLWGLRSMRSRAPAALALVVAMVAVRTVLAASRSDWWGGWGVGPRYLVPVIPFAIAPLAWLLDGWADLEVRSRRLIVSGLAVSALAMSHLAGYSIFEHMFNLAREGTVDGVDYFTRSHWYPSASPYIGFLALPHLDMLSVGALRLARHGHPGMAACFGAIAAWTGVAALVLWRALASGAGGKHAPRHVVAARGQDHSPG